MPKQLDPLPDIPKAIIFSKDSNIFKIFLISGSIDWDTNFRELYILILLKYIGFELFSVLKSKLSKTNFVDKVLWG